MYNRFISLRGLVWVHTIPQYQTRKENRICGVMVSVLASNAVDRGFEPQSGQTKDYEIGSCWFSTKNAALRRLVGSESR